MAAYTSGFNTMIDSTIWSSTGVDQLLSKLDMSQILSSIFLKDTAILGQIGASEVCHNLEIEWLQDSLNAVEVTGAYTHVGTTLVISAPATTALLQKVLRAGAVLNQTNSNIYVQVSTSEAFGDLTLDVSAYGNLGPSGDIASTTWQVINLPFAEGADASTDISKARTVNKNYTQIFERSVQISDSRKGMAMHAVPDELRAQIARRMMEIKREMNMSVLKGLAYYSGGAYLGVTGRRTMKSIFQLIKDFGNTDTYKDASGVALSQDLLNTLVRKMYDLGGLDESSKPILLLNSTQQEKVSDFHEDYIRTQQSDRTAGAYVKYFMSKLGVELKVVLDRWMPHDSVAVLDANRIKLRHLNKNQLRMEKLARTGLADKWQISGEYSLEVRNAGEAHGWMYDLAT
jgi:hypothetical protein